MNLNTELPLFHVQEESSKWDNEISHKHRTNDNTKSLLIIIIVFAGLILIEFFTGLFQGIFHLMADALHNVLGVLTLIFSFISITWSKVSANSKYTYGFSRMEVIASFSNCCFLVFIGIFLMFRSIHDALEGLAENEHEHHHEKENNQLFLFNSVRLVAHLVGCISIKSHSKFNDSHENLFDRILHSLKFSKNGAHSKKNEDIRNPDMHSTDMIDYTLYLFFKIGAIMSLCFVVVDLFPTLKKLKIEFALFLGLLFYIIVITRHIIGSATDILLQGFPNDKKLNLEELGVQIQAIPHVLKVKRLNYWALNTNYLVLNLNIVIQTFEMKEKVERSIQNYLQSHFNKIVIDFDIPS